MKFKKKTEFCSQFQFQPKAYFYDPRFRPEEFLTRARRVCHVMISVKTFSLEIKSMASSFIKNIHNFDIFYHFPQFEQSKSEV